MAATDERISGEPHGGHAIHTICKAKGLQLKGLLNRLLLAVDVSRLTPPPIGDEIIKIVESTPLDDASEFEIESDFLPIVREVGGGVDLDSSVDGGRTKRSLSHHQPPKRFQKQG